MRLALQILLPFILIICAVSVVVILVKFKEPKKTQSPEEVVPQAEIIQVSPSDHHPPIRSFGTVQPLFETTLTPQVSGRILTVSKEFRVGQRVKINTVLALIDATDYHAALAREKSNLATAERTLAEEEIRAAQASEDWVASGRKLSDASDFVLRIPQVEAAKASIKSSEAAILKADVDIKRTEVLAPYDAVVTERTASVGNFATSQMSLGTLVATERAEIRLPLTAEQASRIALPKPGDDALEKITITLKTPKFPEASWQADIVRTEPTVDPQNQVTYAIAEVEDPYNNAANPLAVGIFVNASIPANTIKDACLVPEAALINDAYLWALDAKNILVKLDGKRVYSLDGNAYVRISSDDLKPPFRIITRPLSNFREGMAVKPISK